jgi:hypothetical protein
VRWEKVDFERVGLATDYNSAVRSVVSTLTIVIENNAVGRLGGDDSRFAQTTKLVGK